MASRMIATTTRSSIKEKPQEFFLKTFPSHPNSVLLSGDRLHSSAQQAARHYRMIESRSQHLASDVISVIWPVLFGFGFVLGKCGSKEVSQLETAQ